MICSLKFDRRSAKPHHRAGLSLIELSVVLVIMSIVAAMGLELTANFMDRTAYKVTQQRLEAIDKAIVAFRKVNNRLPCPGYQGLNTAAACFGKEYNGSLGAGTCNNNAGACSANNFAAGTIAFGDVPVRDLGLPLSTMLDGYGNRFIYVVNRNQVYNSGYHPTVNFSTVADAIAVRSGKLDSTCGGGSLCQDRGMASFFVFSVGPDKRMGRTPAGNIFRGCQYGADPADVALTDGLIDTVNCRFGTAVSLVKNGSTPISIPDNVFYDSRFNMGTTDSHFDDLVKWRSKGAL